MNDPKAEEIPEFDIRYTVASDAKYLKQWLQEDGILRWFPMKEPNEIEDSIKRWISFHRLKSSLTASVEGVPCGIATLYLHPYRKLSHQCQFGIIVDPQYRNKGIGGSLIKNLIHLADNYFNIELLHLEVYEGNPAFNLYDRFGFKEFGRQTKWIKDDGEYLGRIFMELLIN